jgi:rhamnosyl/mannosyltransferase
VLQLGKFYPPFHGGMETHLQMLASGLQEHVDVHVAVAANPSPPGRESVDGVHLMRMRTYGVIASTPMCPGLFRVIRSVNPDIVHIHHPHPFAMLAYLTSRTSVPCVVSYHSDIVKQRALRHLIAPIVNRTLACSSAILVTSPQLIDGSSVLRPFREKCHLVPMGIDTAARGGVDAAAVAALRHRYGSRIVLAVGRLTHYKGFDYLIRAMRDVDATLLIVGSGALRAPLAKLVANHGLGTRVHMLGSVPDVRPYYDACDVFVLSSTTPNEAFGIVQLEAMAAGKAVVNTSLSSGVTFACPTDIAALTVPPADSSALARAITRLLADPDLRTRLGDAGRARVAHEFNARKVSERTLQIYRAVAATSPVGRRGHYSAASLPASASLPEDPPSSRPSQS